MLTALLLIAPPAMTRRQIAPPNNPPPGVVISRPDFTLYLPEGWKPERSQKLAIHFHGPSWLTFAEMRRAGWKSAVVNASFGEGSIIYGNRMRSPEILPSWLRDIESEMKKRGGPVDLTIDSLYLSSFSAGYGSIRELVRQTEVFTKIRSVILCDSMYASLAPDRPRRPLSEHIEVWLPLAREALAGRKTMVLSVSSVPTPTYASSSECLQALVAAIGGSLEKPDSSWEASRDLHYPLLRQWQSGRFFGWWYGGYGAGAHATHYRHLGDILSAIER